MQKGTRKRKPLTPGRYVRVFDQGMAHWVKILRACPVGHGKWPCWYEVEFLGGRDDGRQDRISVAYIEWPYGHAILDEQTNVEGCSQPPGAST